MTARQRGGGLRAAGLAANMGVLAALGCSGAAGDGAPPAPGPPVEAAPAAVPAAGAHVAPAPGVAPLTGLALPAGLSHPADRPALAVKIDNHPDAEPQAGLESADLVFEERVEGTSRLLAVFWSRDVERVGPVRSARTSDIDLLGALGRPLFAWSGGNEGVVAAVAASETVDVGVDRLPVLYERDPERFAPHNLMTDTGALRKAAAGRAAGVQAPLAISGSASAPAGSVPVRGAAVDLEGVVATWAWDPTESRWLRFQRGRPHLSESGEQVGAANVVVLDVTYTTSAADADSPEAVTVGKGAALLLSADGTGADLVWERSDGDRPFTLFDTTGGEVALGPGSSWIELPRPGHTSLLAAEEAAAVLATR